MNFFDHYLGKVRDTIESLTEKGISTISVKIILRRNHVKSSNRSEINFYWRALKQLEKQGRIKRHSDKRPYVYRILSIEPDTPTEVNVEGKVESEEVSITELKESYRGYRKREILELEMIERGF